MRFLKPLDTDIMAEVAEKYDHIITVEDGALNGGFGSAVLEWLADNGYTKRVTRLGIPDTFIEHGKPAELYRIIGLDTEGIVKAIQERKTEIGTDAGSESSSKIYFDYAEQQGGKDRKAGLNRKTEN